MKSSFNKYWILMVLFILVNIIVFSYFSKGLEKYIADRFTDSALSKELKN